MRRLLALIVVGGLGLAACSRESVSSPASSTPAVVSTSSTVSGATTAPPSTVPVTTTPATTAPASTAVPSSSVVPDTSSPATTAPTTPATSPPPSTVPPTDETAHVYITSRTDGPAYAWHRLGAWDGGGWVDLDDVAVFADPTTPQVAITSVDLPGVAAGAYGLAPWGCIDVDVHNGIIPSFAIAPLTDDPGGLNRQQAIAVTGATWPLQPRPVSAVGVDADVYQDTAEALLAGSGIDPALGDVVQVIRVDLDGDGTEEVLVSFERLTPPVGQPGDMSLVYGRVVTGAGVADQVLAQHVITPPEPDFPMIAGFRIAAIADLNGDARMEVVMATTAWEYIGTTIYEFDGTALTQIMQGGCGV